MRKLGTWNIWEEIGQIQSLLGMTRDEMLVKFQNLQLATNLSHSPLKVEIKIFIYADTKKSNFSNIEDRTIK